MPAYAGVLLTIVVCAAALGVWLMLLADTARLFEQGGGVRRFRPGNSPAKRTKEKESFVSE